ncbi:MAG: flagellar filament capping protein FliD [Synergistaceae bacterium]|nr:flagellar filament capping protein FliD [Synergistaceae bacterium]
MASMSVSGIVSGMDWESMIDEIITNASKPAQPQVAKKTDLTNKKSLFEEMKTMMNSLQSSLSPLKLPSTYKAKEIEIERLDSTKSYKGVLTATVNADAEVNVWDVEVKQLASAQTNRSKQITASNLNSTLSGVTGSTLYIEAGGQKIGVEVKSSDTLESLKSRINTTLKTLDNPIHVTASVVDSKLILKSDYTGLGAFTASETINYSSNGYNTLTGFTVSDDTRENVKITSGSTTYTYGTDYVIANGNEIRWKKFDQSKEVALDDTVTVKYTMAADDVYTNKGTYGTKEANTSSFNVIDNGTIASRVKIVDDNGKTYTYGKDFKIVNSKVVWLEEEESYTNEPSSYTVSYTNTAQKSYTASGTKASATSTPASYTVQYTDDILPSTAITYGRNDDTYSYIKITAGSITTFSGMTALDGVSSVTSSGKTYLTFDDDSELKININGTDYVYGRDYVIRKGASSDEMFFVPYFNSSSEINNYLTAAGKNAPDGVPISPRTDIQAENPGTFSYTHTTTIDSTDTASISTLLNDSSTDTSNIVILKSDGTQYTEGTDYHISNGEIVWTLPNDTTDITMSQFAELQTKYAEAAGSELSTVTLIDGNGVLRTYVAPEDNSLFTMSAGGVNYEYGRDYVLRVNDAGTGYRFDWLIDGSDTIADANTTVATYAASKNISTSSWKAAPAEGTAYNFGFSYNYASTPLTGTVNKTDTDKSLSGALSGASVPSSAYGTSALTITDGTKTYSYGTDYVINSSGVITWLDQASTTPAAYTATYTFSGNASKTVSGLGASTTLTNVTGLPTLNSMGVKTFTSGGQYYVDEAEGKAAFTLTDSDGNTYEYGKDFALRSTSLTGGTLQLAFSHYSSWPSDFSNQDKTRTIPTTANLTLTYNNSVSATVTSSETVEDALGFLPSNYSKLTISDTSGNAYTESTDYTIDTSTGAITWATTTTAPTHPNDGVGYTLTYEAFDAITATGTTDGSSSQEVSITVDSGYGNYGGDKRSYEQILSDTGLTSSSSSDDWAKYFTLETTDGATTYTYGTDYTIIQGSDTDSSTGEHNVMINWLNVPANGTSFTLSYGGNSGEVLTTDGVKRSATDTITGSPLATAFDGGTNTITYAGKTYYEGVDFDITKDDDGNATVTWISDDDGGYEWYYPTSNSYYTITHTDDSGNTTSYNAYRTSSATLDMSKYGMKTAGGSISVQYGEGLSYRLDAAADSETGYTGYDVIKGTYGIDITPTTGGTYTFNWVAPTLTSRSNLPSYGEELTVSYEYDANTFDLSDDGDGDLLQALGFTKSDGTYDDYTAAKNAILVIDGEQEVERDSNDIGADYENELIKGVTMHLKGLGEVSLDISQDAEKAVESIQTFVDSYNDLMSWMNTRMTESQLDEDTKATVDSDDFRMRWGLLHGNSLLRNTKSQMRSLTSQNFAFSFTERKSSEEVYGTMSFNGLRTSSTLRLRIGTKYVDVTIDPSDTIETIAKKISDDTKGGPMNDIYYDDNGNKLATPLLKAYAENDKLVIQSTSNDEITMSGSAAMNALKMNYTYKGLYQIGIESTATDYGKSGELEFDASEFMEALEDNPDEVQSLMMTFVTQFDTWTKSMLNSSSSGETSGTLTREIENIQSRIDSINEYLEKYQERLDRMEENLRTRYGNTETQFAKLSQQANSIAAILNQLNGSAQGGGYGQTSS